MKVAPVIAAVDDWNTRSGQGSSAGPSIRFHHQLVHTGQHYDAGMSEVFFRDLGLPEPDHYLGVGSGSHAEQTAAVLVGLERLRLDAAPDLVVVVGDVNSTLGAALWAAKRDITVAHVEAGLRSGDRSMPEELNRLLVDQLAELLFTTEDSARKNLNREGVEDERIHFVGNTMIDSLDRIHRMLDAPAALARAGVEPRSYALVTLHRPSNVDDPAALDELVAILIRVAERMPVVWPVHVRVRWRLGLDRRSCPSGGAAGLRFIEAAPYPEFLALMSEARLVLTDSGGVQEETTVLGVPCITLRTSTERPVTIAEGTNRLADPADRGAILRAVDDTLARQMPSAVRPELWDGHAADRIVAVIAEWAAKRL